MSKERFASCYCGVWSAQLVSFLVTMQIVSQRYIMHDDLAIVPSLAIVKKILALISIEREFLSVDAKNEA